MNRFVFFRNIEIFAVEGRVYHEKDGIFMTSDYVSQVTRPGIDIIDAILGMQSDSTWDWRKWNLGIENSFELWMQPNKLEDFRT